MEAWRGVCGRNNCFVYELLDHSQLGAGHTGRGQGNLAGEGLLRESREVVVCRLSRGLLRDLTGSCGRVARLKLG